MLEKTKGVRLSAKANLFHMLWFFLSFLGVLSYSISCHAVSNQYYLESDIETDSDAAVNYCQPAEIAVKDKVVRAGLLYDISADAVVWEKNKDQSFPIASLTKMMVALITIEDIFDGKIELDTTVRVTPEAAKMAGSKVYLKTGCCVSVEELLKAALISSGNDACYLLAQFLGGTEAAFVQRMNQRAAELGMKNTFYSNSTGMPAADRANDNHSSPYDLLILSNEMLKYDQLIEIAGMSDAVITQDERPIKLRNHNGLVKIYSEVDGFKTGFTQNAKYCLVATANKSDRRLVCIVLGVPDRGTRNQFVASTISRYYETLGMGGLAPKNGYAAATCVPKNRLAAQTLQKAYEAGFNADANSVYRVKKGDTLYKIANKYGCSVAELKSWNKLRGSRLNPGQELAIYRDLVNEKSSKEPSSSPAATSTASEQPQEESQPPAATSKADSRIIHFYTVRPGDTLWTISQKYEGISVKNIMKSNRIKRAKDLKPGTTLKIETDV